MTPSLYQVQYFELTCAPKHVLWQRVFRSAINNNNNNNNNNKNNNNNNYNNNKTSLYYSNIYNFKLYQYSKIFTQFKKKTELYDQ